MLIGVRGGDVCRPKKYEMKPYQCVGANSQLLLELCYWQALPLTNCARPEAYESVIDRYFLTLEISSWRAYY